MFSSDHYDAPAREDKIINANKTTEFLAAVDHKKERKGTIAFIAPQTNQYIESPATPPAPPAPNDFVQVGYDEVDGSLTQEQKERVKHTVETTKKALKSEWREVEKTIPDGLTAQEKQMAQQEYLSKLDKMDWKSMEQNLKAQINVIDLDKINENLNEAIVKAKIDSVQAAYCKIVVELEKAEAAAKCKALPMPDASKQQVQKAKLELQNKIKLLEAAKTKKVVRI
jgi:hypothetical protein